MKVGDLVRDMYMKSLGVGCLIEVINNHRDWDGDTVCKVYWSGTEKISLRQRRLLSPLIVKGRAQHFNKLDI